MTVSHMIGIAFAAVVTLFVCLAASAPSDPIQRRHRHERIPLFPPEDRAGRSD
jgi:hypothetical protein